jgi:hypothetical protein
VWSGGVQIMLAAVVRARTSSVLLSGVELRSLLHEAIHWLRLGK